MQKAQSPQEGVMVVTTRSPWATRVTALPTRSTTPTTSCPRTAGVLMDSDPFT